MRRVAFQFARGDHCVKLFSALWSIKGNTTKLKAVNQSSSLSARITSREKNLLIEKVGCVGGLSKSKVGSAEL